MKVVIRHLLKIYYPKASWNSKLHDENTDKQVCSFREQSVNSVNSVVKHQITIIRNLNN